MNKLIRDGKVGVLVSPGYGAGWSTWNDVEQCVFSPEIIVMVESGDNEKITNSFCEKLFGVDHFCALGSDQLEVEWLEVGTAFSIDEHDGYEELITQENLFYIA